MDETIEDDEKYVEDVPEGEQGLQLVALAKLPPQLVRVHQHDGNCQRDQETGFLQS